MVINLEKKKIKTKLASDHFDLRFILNLSTNNVDTFHSQSASVCVCVSFLTKIMTG